MSSPIKRRKEKKPSARLNQRIDQTPFLFTVEKEKKQTHETVLWKRKKKRTAVSDSRRSLVLFLLPIMPYLPFYHFTTPHQNNPLTNAFVSCYTCFFIARKQFLKIYEVWLETNMRWRNTTITDSFEDTRVELLF